jgi:type IV secretion system protein VirD4
MVITDPKGDLLADTGAFLEHHGYIVKVFNLFQMDCSDCYNPFAYIRDENDVAVLVNGVVANMGEGKNQGDHWEANAKAVLNSICYYIYYEEPYTRANFGRVLELLNEWESSEDDDFKSAYDERIDELEKAKGSDHSAVVWRRKVAAKGSELSSIISTAQTITSIFAQSSLRTMTQTDSMELDKVGDRPTALFVITPPTTKAFNFLAALMYTQLFTLLQNKANKDYKDQGMVLPHKVWFLLDEFANIGKIPDFDQQITLVRSAGIFCSIIVQSPSQIEAIYDKITPTILSNCSITLFLGAPGNTQKDDSAADYISKNLGTKTIQAETTNVDYLEHQRDPKMTFQYSASERPLMTTDEVKRLPNEDCIILLGGQKPIHAKKIQKLEECMNYDIFKKIGPYNVEKKKSTKDTYVQGRAMSEEIESIQNQCRAAELQRRREFAEIDSKYMIESGEIQETQISYESAEQKCAGVNAQNVEEKFATEESKAFNWREELGEEESDIEFIFNDEDNSLSAENSSEGSETEDDGLPFGE